MIHPELPAELALLILSYLPVSSIGYLRRVNRDWSYFVKQNSATVYRNAAFQEGFIGKNQSQLSDLNGTATGTSTASGDGGSWGTQGAVGYEHDQGLYSRKALRGVDSWETLCKRQKLIHRSWAGHAPSRILSSPRVLPSPLALNTPENSHYRRVHRIKVDEQVGITLATTELGGLVVRDIETDEVLWELPIWYVHSHAHLEYERGYIIFDRTDGSKEVWRRTQDVEADEARRNLRQSYTAGSQEQDGVNSGLPTTSTSQRSESDKGDDEDDDLPRPKPDQRQLHVANYLHTLAVAYAAAAASPGSSPPSSASSSPISLHPTSFLPSPSPSAPSPSKPNSKPYSRTSKAHFTPFAVLRLPAPEASRAYRFVYPSLLVAAMDRAYVFDVPRARVVQVVEGVQMVRRVRVPEEEEEEHGRGDARAGVEQEASASARATPRTGTPVASGSAGTQRSNPDQDESETSDEDEDDEGEEDDPDSSLAQFVGQIRYVEISPRHIFIAGRHVLRVFSRETGRCVMNLGSTRERYGAWAWRVGGGGPQGAGAQDARPADRDKGKQRAREGESAVDAVDTYDAARTEEREAVRVSLRPEFRTEMGGHDGMVIDQFIAVHASRDGKHFVALLSGARLIVMHHFEALLARHRVPRRTASRHPSHASPRIREPGTRLRDGQMDKVMDKAVQYYAQGTRDKDLFMHTMDIRLGSPRVTDSVYLAYEHDRIGVVTSNAVYIVIPTSPLPPAPLSSLRQGTLPSVPSQITYPYPPTIPLHVTRLPYFVNPSWLGAVTCLMMSDTGLYLNWNPTTPVSSAQRSRHGYGFGSVFGSLNPFVPLGGGGPQFAMLDDDEDEEHDDEGGMEDIQEEPDEEEAWVDEGDEWDEADGDDDGVHWHQHSHADGDEGEDAADAALDHGWQGADGAETSHVTSPFLSITTDAHLEDLATKHPSEHERRREHRPAGEDRDDAGRDDKNRSIWEAEYQRDLRDMEANEGEWYQVLPNGDMFVAPNPRPIEMSEVSTIFAVEFVPDF